MANRGGRVRFLDQVSITSPQTIPSSGGGGGGDLVITNNEVSGRLLTTSGINNQVNGNTDLIFVNGKLGIGIASEPEARLEISGISEDLILIKNSDGNGIKFTSEGYLQLLPFIGDAIPIEGGIIYSGSSFFIGV
jgi:hypothetical protein